MTNITKEFELFLERTYRKERLRKQRELKEAINDFLFELDNLANGIKKELHKIIL